MKGRDLQRAIIKRANGLGWRASTFPPVNTDRGWRTACGAQGKGWPDICFLRERMVAMEVKGDGDSLRPDQKLWQSAFLMAGIEFYVATPRMWLAGEIDEILAVRGDPAPSVIEELLFVPPDWRPPTTVRDPQARKTFHRNRGERGICAVCETSLDLSLHHVYGRDDVPANYIFCCGDGVRGCHGLITRNDPIARAKLGRFIVEHRHDIVVYVLSKAGREQGIDWFERRLFVDVRPILIGNEIGGSDGT